MSSENSCGTVPVAKRNGRAMVDTNGSSDGVCEDSSNSSTVLYCTEQALENDKTGESRNMMCNFEV